MSISTKNIKETIMKSTAAKKLFEFANSNGFAKFLVSLIVGFIMLIPSWIYFIIRWLIEPANFWQELAIVVICGCVMGWLQVILLFFGIIIIVGIITDEI